jgi:hypothetical protein
MTTVSLGIGCVFTQVMVSQYVVTSPADSGPGSLRDIVSSACNGDTIYFDQGLDTLGITSDINLEVDLNFIGNGPTSTIISGESVTRVFNITLLAEIKMMKLGLINVYESKNGGAILNLGVCILRNVLLENNFESSTPKAFTNLGSLEIVAGTVSIR